MKVTHFKSDGTVVEEDIQDVVPTQKELNENEINKFTNWFNSYFDKQLIQSQWQDDFKPSYDTLFKKEYKDIDELKIQAQAVRNQIKEKRGK